MPWRFSHIGPTQDSKKSRPFVRKDGFKFKLKAADNRVNQPTDPQSGL